MADLIFLENDQNNKQVDDLEERRESLLVLATLGATREYLGEELSADKIYKLSRKSVDKYFSRYQLVQGKKVSDVLRKRGIQLTVRMISFLLPIQDSEKLVKNLEEDELVNRELSNMIGLLIMKGGRFVALASGLIQIANHIAEPAQLLVRGSNSKDEKTSTDSDITTTL